MQKGKMLPPSSTCVKMFPGDFQSSLQISWDSTEGKKHGVIPQKQASVYHRAFALVASTRTVFPSQITVWLLVHHPQMIPPQVFHGCSPIQTPWSL